MFRISLIIMQYFSISIASYIILSVIDSKDSTFEEFDDGTEPRACLSLFWPIVMIIVAIGALNGLYHHISNHIKRNMEDFEK